MAEAVAVTESPQECPVCHEDYTDPKILPCAHLVCQKCLMSWLKTQSNQAGCPLCRQPILSSTEQGQGDFSTLVDALPTDHATKIKIESQKILSASDICNICDNDSVAIFFCFQCDTKLCGSCSKVHSKLPSSSDHVVKELSSLTTEQLAADRRFPCNNHQEKAAELYCSCHEELICFLCATSTHRKCTDVEEVAVSATTQRKELEEQNQRLRQKEAALMAQIEQLDSEVAAAKTKFGDMQNEIINMFAELQRLLEDQKKELLEKVYEKENQFLEEKSSRRAKLEKLQSTLAAHANSVDTMIVSAPDKALLATLRKLKQRGLEWQNALNPWFQQKVVVGDVFFDENVVNGLKKTFGITGEVRDSPKKQGTQQQCLACGTVTESTFQLVVNNVKNLKKQIESQCCIVRGIPWKIMAKPTTDEHDVKYLGFFLMCDLPSTMNTWSCAVEAELRVLKTTHTHYAELRVLKTTHTHYALKFQKTYSGLPGEKSASGWGNPEFMLLDELTDPNNGYIKDGKVTLEVHLVADDPEGLW